MSLPDANILYERLVLASGSSVRAQILSDYGFQYVVEPANIDETPLPGESVQALVQRLALTKAKRIQKNHHPLSVILGADTMVVSPTGEVLGKPIDAEQAAQWLSARSGATEYVYTGYAVLRGSGQKVGIECSEVHFRAISDSDQSALIGDPSQWQGAAGGIRIEGLLEQHIESITGETSNVMGLPIGRIAEVLRSYRESGSSFF